jgi:hypothetical protein
MNGTKLDTEAAGSSNATVGERGSRSEEVRTTNLGPAASDHAGTSNDKTGENPVRRKPKVSWGREIRPGLVGS